MINVQPIDTKLRFLVDRLETEIARDYTNRYDQSGNGIVERSEFQGTSGAFDSIDRNHNNRLELNEVKRYIDLLKQHEPIRKLNTTAPGRPQKGRSFSVAPHERLTGLISNYFSEEIRQLDKNGNGFLEVDELGGLSEQFSMIDRDRNNLVSTREWTEGFIENHVEIQMVLKAYRFSHSAFQNKGGIIRMNV